MQEQPSFEEGFIQQLFEESKSWAFANGLVMGTPEGDEAKVTHAPFILLPSSMPASVLQQAYSLAPDFNLLVHRASQDHAFICNALDHVSAADEFTGSLLRLYKEARAAGKTHVRSIPLFFFLSLQLNRVELWASIALITCCMRKRAEFLFCNKLR